MVSSSLLFSLAPLSPLPVSPWLWVFWLPLLFLSILHGHAAVRTKGQGLKKQQQTKTKATRAWIVTNV